MSAKKRTFEVGDRVFGKVRGYPAWPARVEGVAGGTGANTKYNVFFYGTYESALLKANEIWPFDEESKAKHGKQKRKMFAEAMYEIENNPGIQTAEMLMDKARAEGGAEAGVAPAGEGAADAGAATDQAAGAQETPEAAATPTTPAQQKKGKKSGGAATPAVTPAARGTKRKAADDVSGASPATASPAAKVARGAASTPASEKTSRSGRVIKPKQKFEDEGANEKEEAKATPSKKAAAASEGRKMWVQVKATGDMVEINLDKDRPVSFDSKDAELQWDRATAKNALKFKEKVEAGEFIPDEVRRKIEEKVNRTPEEEAILKREKQVALRKEKVRWLKVEQRLIDLDLQIKQSLHFERPEMAKCMEALEELVSLQLAPLMLKKQPDIVTTVRKLRKYVGPQAVTDAKLGEQWMQESQKIRLKANQIYMKLQNAFAVPEGSDFWETFDTKLSEFRTVTKGMGEKQLLTMVSDPTKVLEAAG